MGENICNYGSHKELNLEYIKNSEVNSKQAIRRHSETFHWKDIHITKEYMNRSLNTVSHLGNANKNHNEESFHKYQNG